MTYEQYERLSKFLDEEEIPHELELVHIINGVGMWHIKLSPLLCDLQEV